MPAAQKSRVIDLALTEMQDATRNVISMEMWWNMGPHMGGLDAMGGPATGILARSPAAAEPPQPTAWTIPCRRVTGTAPRGPIPQRPRHRPSGLRLRRGRVNTSSRRTAVGCDRRVLAPPAFRVGDVAGTDVLPCSRRVMWRPCGYAASRRSATPSSSSSRTGPVPSWPGAGLGWLGHAVRQPRPTWRAGLLITAPLDWINVYILRRWTYAPHMPVLAGIGLVPLVQGMVIPPVVLWLAARHLGVRPGRTRGRGNSLQSDSTISSE